MSLVIRRVDIADEVVREGISALHDETFNKDEWIGTGKPEPRGDWWVVFDGKTPAAFAGIVPSLQWTHTGYLCRAGVLPAYRGLGLQQKLIRKRVKHARSLGWVCVLTDTLSDNAPSMNNLIACGFRPYSPARPWGYSGAVYWRLKLE